MFLHPDAVFAAEHAADIHADLQDGAARLQHPVQRSGNPVVEQQQGMQVAVAGMEDVGDGQIEGLADAPNLVQHVGNGGSGDHAVLHVVVGGDAAHGAEGALAAQPEEVALGRVLRDADVPGLVGEQYATNLGFAFVQLGGHAVHIQQQHGGRVHRQIGLRDELGHGFQRQLVHHLHGGRDDAGGHNAGDRGAAGGHRIERGQQRAHAGRRVYQLDDGLGHDAEGALAAAEQPGQVIAGAVGQPAGGDHAAIHGDELDAQHVVGGYAVEQGVRAAGVGGDVAAQRAGLLAGRVWGVVKSEAAGVGAEVGVDHARLDHGATVARVHLKDAVHTRGGDHHPAAACDGAAAEPRARAARHHRHAVP